MEGPTRINFLRLSKILVSLLLQRFTCLELVIILLKVSLFLVTVSLIREILFCRTWKIKCLFYFTSEKRFLITSLSLSFRLGLAVFIFICTIWPKILNSSTLHLCRKDLYQLEIYLGQSWNHASIRGASNLFVIASHRCSMFLCFRSRNLVSKSSKMFGFVSTYCFTESI